jgi:uncharacterized membrane protein (UPF0127 family)
MRRFGVLTLVTLAFTASAASSAEPFARGTVLVATGKRTVTLNVEIAETPAQRALGLMNRPSLPRNAGMAFVFPADTNGAFWMKDTLIPLSIAFYDAKGKILRILLMEPCAEDPCPTYSPGVKYRGALEVNRGTFARLGIKRGHVIRLRRVRA